MTLRHSHDLVIQAYIDHLNGLINTTVSDSRLALLEVAGGSDQKHIVRFQSQRMPLELKPNGFLRFQQLVHRVEDHVEVTQANYMFSHSEDPDDEAAWVFRYEYDRHPKPTKPQSHLHVNAERNGESIEHIHFPTSRISVEQLIAHLIMEHGIESARDDWRDFLGASHQGFVQRRTDSKTVAFP